MDSDSCKREQIIEEGTQEKSEGPKQERTVGDRKSNVRNVFPSIGIRCAFPKYNEINTFLLDYGFYFLLPFSTILYATLFLFS